MLRWLYYTNMKYVVRNEYLRVKVRIKLIIQSGLLFFYSLGVLSSFDAADLNLLGFKTIILPFNMKV